MHIFFMYRKPTRRGLSLRIREVVNVIGKIFNSERRRVKTTVKTKRHKIIMFQISLSDYSHVGLRTGRGGGILGAPAPLP